ncbi:SMP-30/gluconolactonase/LRE family protein [Allorhodopirellula heiligendammensis]|uniref:Gluconolactonase n=1 Tax=Allorhodopirellula heiligendammensis TaxID=2714739 RepID=A0A5C6C954_9BACT|nr:SMP-30/gluconolactonase/LRE family protein [Allorhodopirellula heiligendammensis]TWU19884.1 Gluconolactonase precursor [Allorhodopirellula heiligendammensis]
MKVTVALAVALAISSSAHAQSERELQIIADGDRSGLKIEANVAFTEGPAWHQPTNSVYFTDTTNHRIMRRDASGSLSVYRTPSGDANGLAFDQQLRLIACEGGRDSRRVTRTELDGTITILTSDFNGKKYNSPNDVTVDSQGRIYFTDPRYGQQDGMEIFAADGSPIEGVYRIDPDGAVTQILASEVHRPNGIAISADEKFLFVADNDNRKRGNRKLWRFDLKADGSVDPVSQKELFDWRTELGVDRGPDGMCVGPQGNLYVTAGLNFDAQPTEVPRIYEAGVYVIDPSGKGLLNFIPIPQDVVTNCTFGGDDGKTLFVTAGHTLYSIHIQ